jgi:hypothetical protein
VRPAPCLAVTPGGLSQQGPAALVPPGEGGTGFAGMGFDREQHLLQICKQISNLVQVYSRHIVPNSGVKESIAKLM